MFECQSVYQQALQLDAALKKDSVTVDRFLVVALLEAIDSTVHTYGKN